MRSSSGVGGGFSAHLVADAVQRLDERVLVVEARVARRAPPDERVALGPKAERRDDALDQNRLLARADHLLGGGFEQVVLCVFRG